METPFAKGSKRAKNELPRSGGVTRHQTSFVRGLAQQLPACFVYASSRPLRPLWWIVQADWVNPAKAV
ncbi:hypothetical protein X797_012465 [Metarhizium robertsii]|uniref:Uncharacterized protein n=1 Tax=Metarhizium robertsii TaxID=568076 RepID=A0A014MTK1_9HYPO|nr:hypothetical protein X797_012465 [Metarhizium robertsii]